MPLTPQQAPEFNPSKFGQVLLWYAPEGLSSLQDGQPIPYWLPQIGPGLLAPYDPEYTPVKYTRNDSGLPYARLTWPQGFTSPYVYNAVRHGTIAAVFKPADIPSPNSLCVIQLLSQSLDARFDYSHINDDRSIQWGHYDGEGGPDSSSLCDPDTWYVCIGRADPSAPRFLLNNAVKIPEWSGASNPGNTIANLILNPPTEDLHNEIAEVIYFNELLSNENMLALANALLARHAIEPFPP